MATETKSATAGAAAFDTAAEQAVERIRELNERLLSSTKAAGLVALDAYEKTVRSLVDFEGTVAGASQLDWVSALAGAHSKFIQDVSSAYTKAARDLLK